MLRMSERTKKWIMAVAVILLAIAFGLPSVTNMIRRGHADPVVGSALASGAVKKIKLSEVQAAGAELKLLQALDVDTMSQYGLVSQIGELGRINPYVNAICYAALFGQGQYSRAVRQQLYQQAGNWAQDADELEAMIEDIDALTDSQSSVSALSYLLLKREALGAGFGATQAQINALLKYRAQVTQGKYGRAIPLREFLAQNPGYTESHVRDSITGFLAILQYAEQLTGSALVSEPELKQFVRDSLQVDDVQGDFVTFRADMFMDEIGDPTMEQVEAHFEEYKGFLDGETNALNPHGIGYKLPDRVKIEYLHVDVAQLMKQIEEDFQAMSVVEQEEKIQAFWLANRELFRRVTNPAEAREGAQPVYEDMPFDDVADQVQSLWLQSEAKDQGERAVLDAIAAIKAATTDDAVADYAVVAQGASTERVPVRYGQTEYLSYDQLKEYRDFGQTYKMRNRRPQRELAGILFTSKPFQEEQKRNLDFEPAAINENIGPVFSFGPGQKPQACYVVRIVGADPERVAVSLADDGRQGGGAPTVAVEDSQLYGRAQQGWRRLQAYAMAEQKAQEFLTAATQNWDDALAATNETLKDDPCSPVDPLYSNGLEQIRRQVRSLQEQMQSRNQQIPPAMQDMMMRQLNLLKDAMELAQEQDNGDKPVLLPNPRDFSYAVFKQLKVETPAESEYLRRRPLVAEQMVWQHQGALALTHFNPKNIQARNQYQEINALEKTDEEEPAEEEQSDTSS